MRTLQGERELLECFYAQLARASQFSLGMALITRGGLSLVEAPLRKFLSRGGSARVLFGVDLPTDPEAIELLMKLASESSGALELRRFQQGRRPFHLKLSIFTTRTGSSSAIIGSSNLSEGGFRDNHETNVMLNDAPGVVQNFADYFEELFVGAQAQEIDDAWLTTYSEQWKCRRTLLREEEHLRRRARSAEKPPAGLPNRIYGHTFCFTGKIDDWPRVRRLYPAVKRAKGTVVEHAFHLGHADCLVHGEILGGRRTTQKLRKARRLRIPIMTEQRFLQLLDSARRR